MEEWCDIKGYEGIYQVSNLGRVRSLDRISAYSNGRLHTYKGKVLKQYADVNGYLCVYLCKDDARKCKLVHRLVWEAFNGEIPSGMEVNHIDENPSNPSLSNLNLLTHKENLNWGACQERRAAKLKNNPLKSKPVYGYDKDGNLVVSFPSTAEAGRNGYETSHVAACARGKLKTHKGLRWSYFI